MWKRIRSFRTNLWPNGRMPICLHFRTYTSLELYIHSSIKGTIGYFMVFSHPQGHKNDLLNDFIGRVRYLLMYQKNYILKPLSANLTTLWPKNCIVEYFKENIGFRYLTTSKILKSRPRDFILVPEDPSY